MGGKSHGLLLGTDKRVFKFVGDSDALRDEWVLAIDAAVKTARLGGGGGGGGAPKKPARPSAPPAEKVTAAQSKGTTEASGDAPAKPNASAGGDAAKVGGRPLASNSFPCRERATSC
jgi:hypothetical protein